jgi:hypothetical protein
MKTSLPLDGKKTYVLAAIQAVLYGLNVAGVVPDGLVEMVTPWLAGLMGVTVAHKVAREALP